MALERTKERLDLGGRSRRYPRGNEQDLDDVANPHTIEDESRRTAREYLFRYRWHLAAMVVLALAIVGIVIVYLSKFVPQVLANPLVQRSAKIVGLLAIGFVLGNKSTKNSLANRDELVLLKPDGASRYLGELDVADQGSYPVFRPIKGFAFFGLSARYYTVGDLGPELARKTSRKQISLDDYVAIRLHPEFVEIARTETGTVVAQISDGLETDPFGDDSNVAASLPDLADEGRVSNLKDKITDLYEKLENAKDQREVFRIQRDAARDEAKQTRKEYFDEWTGHYREIREVETRSTRSREDGTLGAEPSVDAVDREVTNADD